MALRPIGGTAEAAGAGELFTAPLPEETTTQEAAVASEADTLRGEQRFVGAVRARGLQSQLAAQEAQTSQQTQEPSVEFRVEVPQNGDARAMRDAILKGPPFYYTDADISALEQSGPGEEFYISASAHPERWATPAEVKSFPVSGGLTTIPVRESLVQSLVAFRARRRVEQATAGITDAALRRQVSEQLFAVLTGRGDQGVRDAFALSELAKGDTSGSGAVTEAIRKAADDPAGRQNAALQFALARASASEVFARRGKFYGPFDDANDFAEARTRALEAVRLAGGLDPSTGRERPGAVVNRQQAAALNMQASLLFRQLGDEYDATQREMIARFYESDDQERRAAATDTLNLWPTIPRWKPPADGRNYVRPTTEEEKRLREFDAEFRASQEEEPTGSGDEGLEKAKNARRTQESRIMNPGTRQRSVEAPVDEGQVYVGRTATDSERARNGELFTRRTGTVRQVNEEGVARGAAVAGAVDLVNTGLAYYTLYRKTQELERYQAERVPLEAAANRATSYPVPPRPERVEQIESALRQRLAATTDAQEKARLEEALRFIPTMREASRAFWNR
ncbi:MAG: hypothetical protein JOZ02_18840 [Acidobacteria bacterium]|nr:hypothetical protein [Acidobacteriota bacterium]